jgi:AcrR family transcriptional regulator
LFKQFVNAVQPGNEPMNTAQRRQNLREALVDAAERAIAARGLAGLRARDLAAEVGCAVGAIYNVVDDLDDLAFAVNARTLAALEVELDTAGRVEPDEKGTDVECIVARLVRMAAAYLDFAAANTLRWRALFDHRLPEGRPVPGWFLAEQVRLFRHVEQPLRALRPDLPSAQLAMLARSLFSAVHGIVTLGLEEKLGVVPLEALRGQTATIVSAIAAGLSARRPKRSGQSASRGDEGEQ